MCHAKLIRCDSAPKNLSEVTESQMNKCKIKNQKTKQNRVSNFTSARYKS